MASLERKESGRCFYRRSDYPDLDESWTNKHVILWQEGGEPKISVEKII
jgi:succinate dehydrogenase/fumarate reductase flavoprotein subunit